MERLAPFGAQAVVASIDVRKKLLGGWEVVSDGGTKKTGLKPVEHARRMVEGTARSMGITVES